jgi:hypothetical protein
MQDTGRARREVPATFAAGGLVILALFLVVLSVTLSLHGIVKSAPFANPASQDSPFESAVAGESPQGSDRYWYVGAYSTNEALASNSGIRSMIQVKSQTVNGVLAFWGSEAMSNNLWAQVGYYIDNGTNPTGFYQIWNLTDGSEVGGGVCAVSEGIHTFSIVLGNGTVWKFGIDTQIIGSYDMHTNSSSLVYPARAMSEEGYVQQPFTFSNVLFASALQVLKSGYWQNVTEALSSGNVWGIKGHNQNISLSQNEFSVGKDIPPLENNSTLWG